MTAVSPVPASAATFPHGAGQDDTGAGMLARFTIAGWGTALPGRRVTNHELSENLDTSNEWIVARTGIHERRIAGEGESTGPLALQAAHRALAAADLEPADIDMLIVSTSTPEQPIPSTASGVTAAMGIGAGAFDLNAACAGFVYGLVVAGGLLQTGAAQRVMLIGSDTMSRFVDPADRSTAVLFGDGAGAVILEADTQPAATGDQDSQASAAPGGLLACDLVGDPDAFDLLLVPAGGAGRPPSIDTVQAGEHYLYMDGREVFRRAVRGVTDSIVRTLDRAGCKPDEVDLFVPHQANARIIDAVLDRIGLPADRAVQTVDRHGNTSSASVPLAIGEVAESRQLHDGSLVLTSGFGAGLTVGTGLLRWRASHPTPPPPPGAVAATPPVLPPRGPSV